MLTTTNKKLKKGGKFFKCQLGYRFGGHLVVSTVNSTTLTKIIVLLPIDWLYATLMKQNDLKAKGRSTNSD
jgi:hypothetical protein